MLLKKVSQTLKQIENERLQLPIFYESPIALRFEIGDPSLQIFLDKTHLNPTYFRSAFWRISLLYEKTKPFDTLLWVLYRTPDSETDVATLIERFCTLTHLPSPTEIYQQEVTTDEEDPMVRIFLLWDMKQASPRIAPLLEGILSTDFKGFRELSSAVFFFDTERHLLVHPYDDRGADVVAAQADTIRFLYQDCKNWLLSYDFERMKTIFEA